MRASTRNPAEENIQPSKKSRKHQPVPNGLSPARAWVEDHPYSAFGAAFGVGLVLLTPMRRLWRPALFLAAESLVRPEMHRLKRLALERAADFIGEQLKSGDKPKSISKTKSGEEQ